MKKLAPALVVLLVTASGALAARLATTGTYKGTTSEGNPVTFKITDHGKVISNFATTLAYNGECGQGGGPDFNAKASRIAIGAQGKFSEKITLRLTTVAQ